MIPWVDTFGPPARAWDPVQTLPFGDSLYAFGDARRIGIRAVDVRDAATLELTGRYEEPRLAYSISAAAGKVMVVGPGGGLFTRDELDLLAAGPQIDEIRVGLAGGLLDDGRWVVATPDQMLMVEGEEPVPHPSGTWSQGLATHGSTVVIPDATGATVYDFEVGTSTHLATELEARLPTSAVAFDRGIAVASPEWTQAIWLGDTGAGPVDPHGVFDLEQVMSASEWRSGVPRRVLMGTKFGLAELATLGTRAGIALHGSNADHLALPPGTYIDGDAQDGKLYLVTANRATYRSQLITLDISDDAVSLASIEAFTGSAAGVAADADRLYVADADEGIRVYDISNGPVLLGIVELGR